MRTVVATGTTVELALPESGAPSGALVIWPDIFGLRPVFDAHAQRLADAYNWAVAAIDPFPGQELAEIEDRHLAVPGLNDVDKLADLDATIDLFGEQAGAAAADAVGVIGFCMGGMYAMKSLASHRVARSAAFYGMVRVPAKWQSPGQGDAIDVVSARPGDLLAIFGTDDPWCPDQDMDDLEALGVQVVRYVGAGHGWSHDETRPTFRPDDARDAWSRAEAWLRG